MSVCIENKQTYIEYREVYSLRCNGIIALGCTTYYHNGKYLIEYVPQSQRCDKDFCITINQTIQHELNHVNQSIKYGYMWEVE